MSHTKKNLRHVDDSAVRFGLSDTQEARFARHDLAAVQTGVTHLAIKLDDDLVDLNELLIFGSHVDGDVEQVADFWTR